MTLKQEEEIKQVLMMLWNVIVVCTKAKVVICLMDLKIEAIWL